MIDALDHVHLYVDDIHSAADWYQQILGFQPDPRFAQWFEQGGPYVIHCAAASLSLFKRQGHSPGHTIAFSIQATVLQALITALNQHGVRYSIVDHQLTWSLYFNDRWDNRLEVTCHQYAAATAQLVATGS